jgi:hypothetical protein
MSETLSHLADMYPMLHVANIGTRLSVNKANERTSSEPLTNPDFLLESQAAVNASHCHVYGLVARGHQLVLSASGRAEEVE